MERGDPGVSEGAPVSHEDPDPDEGDDPRPPERDRVDEEEDESFPASDPHSDWSGGPSWHAGV